MLDVSIERNTTGQKELQGVVAPLSKSCLLGLLKPQFNKVEY